MHSWGQEHCPECPAGSALPSQAQHHNICSCFCPPLILSLSSGALREALAFAAPESGLAFLPGSCVHGNGVSRLPCDLWGCGQSSPWERGMS